MDIPELKVKAQNTITLSYRDLAEIGFIIAGALVIFYWILYI